MRGLAVCGIHNDTDLTRLNRQAHRRPAPGTVHAFKQALTRHMPQANRRASPTPLLIFALTCRTAKVNAARDGSARADRGKAQASAA